MQADKLFESHFDMHSADHSALLNKTFEIRYDVYCREFGFLTEDDEKACREIDYYDCHASHFLLRHKQTQAGIGCARIVHSMSHTQVELPMLEYCMQSIDTDKFNPRHYTSKDIIEFSRLAVVKSFRRRENERNSVISMPVIPEQGAHPKRGYPVVPVSLFLSLLHLFVKGDARFGIAMMEPKLARLLQMFGIKFQKIGDVMDYHGQRAPYLLKQADAEANLLNETRQLYQHLVAQM